MDAVQSAPVVADVDTTIDVVSSGPNFDDFDRVETAKKDIEKAKEKKAPKKEEDVVEKQGNKQVPEAENTKEEKVPEEKTAEEKTPEEKAAEEKATSEKAEELIDVKINGQIEKVKLADLKANYSGKVAYDKKFSELDKERKQLVQDRDTFYKPMAKFKELLSEGKAGDALLHIVDFVGEDSYNFTQKLIAAMTPMVKARLEMTPEQLEAYEAKSELEHFKKKEQSALERSKAEQTQQGLNQRIAKLQETHSISEDDFRTAAMQLKERLTAEGKFKAEEFTPEVVADFHLAKNYSSKTFKAIDSVDKTLASDARLVNELIQLQFENPGMSEADMVELIKEYSGVNNKLKVLTTKSEVVKKAQAPTPSSSNRPEFFSDFED